MNKEAKSDFVILRQKAEKLLKKNQSGRELPISEDDLLELYNEVETHQIELKLQYEELLLARSATEVSAEKYTALYDFAPAGLFTLSGDGEIVELNLTGAAMLGKDRSHLLTRRFGIYISRDTKPIFNHFLWKVFNSQAKESCEVSLSAIDNLPTYVHLTGNVARSGNQCIVAAIDVTERRQAEENLRQSEGKYRNLVENIKEVIYEVDQEGIVKYISASVEKIAGYTPAEIIGRSFMDFVGENGEFLARRLMELRDKHEINNEYKIHTKTGETRWIRLSTKAIFDEDSFKGGSGTLIDITEKKLVELELQRSESLYRSIINASPDAISFTDLQGRITFTSPRSMKIFGYESLDVFQNRPFLDFIDHRDHKKALDSITQLIRGDHPNVQEYKAVRRDGSTFDIETNGKLIRDTEGQATGIVFVTRDISYRKASQEKLSESRQELIRTNEKLVMAQQVGQTGSWTFDFSTQKIGTSAEAKRLFGFGDDEEDFTLDYVEACIPDRERVHQALLDLIDLDKVYNLEYVIHPADGSAPRVILSKARIERDPAGKPVSIIGVIQDITQRKQVEKDLLESEALYRSILQASPDDITISDLAGTILFASSKALAMFGYNESEQLINHNIREFLVPDDYQKAQLQISRMYQDGSSGPGEYQGVRSDGSIFDIEVNAAFIRNSDSKPTSIVYIIRDISKRKIVDEALRESEEKFRTITEQTGDLIGLADMNGFITYASPASASIFRVEPENMIGRNFTEFVDEIDLTKALELFNDVLMKDEQIKDHEFNMKRIDESKFAGELSGTKFRTGTQDFVLVVIRDITERKQAKLKLQKSEQRFREVVEQSREVVWEVDTTGLYTYVSPLAADVYGYTPEQMVGKWHFYDGHPEDQREQFMEAAFEVFRRKESFHNLVSYIVRPDGKEAYISTNGIPLFNEQGELTGYRGADSDVTERIRADQILTARLRLTEFSLSHSQTEIQIMLLDELEKFTNSCIGFFHLLYPDQETLKLQNWSTNTLQSMCTAESHGQHYRINEAGVWVDCVKQRKAIIHNDYRSLPHRKGMPEGHAPVIRELVVPVFRNDLVVAIVGIGNKPSDYNESDIELVSLFSDLAWDIIERKGAEEELQKVNLELEKRIGERTAQLEEVNRELEAFSYSVSHDLRAPLRHISSFVGLFKELEPMQRTEDEIKYLDFISKGADEMSHLIDALLSFSKLNRKELRKTTIHSVAMVEQVVRFFESDTKNRNIRVIIGSLEDCKGDEQLIKQVWINLVSNAIKYTGKKPEAIIEIGCTRGEHELVYFVKDNGDGFDMKNAGKLFGVFQRLHKNSDFEGVGIGLANVKNIITRHGGHCTAEGEKGKGARFSFSLPY